MRAIIMAGGLGTRMSKKFPGVPKCFIELNGKSVLEYQLEQLYQSQIYDVTVVINPYAYDYVSNDVGVSDKKRIKGKMANLYPRMNIDFYVEFEFRGTAGSLFDICKPGACSYSKVYFDPEENEDFLLILGDIIFDMKLFRLKEFHECRRLNVRGEHTATIVTHPSSHINDSDIVLVKKLDDDDDTEVECIIREKQRLLNCANLTSAGIYCLNTSIFRDEKIKSRMYNINTAICDTGIKCSIMDILKLTGLIHVYSYKTSEYIKDTGTPERYNEVLQYIKSGRYNQLLRKAVFLDRDGTINDIENGKFVNSVEDLHLYKYAAEAIKIFNSLGYIVVIVTNQGGINLGYMTEDKLRDIHNKLEMELAKEGAYVDDILYCPHYGGGCGCRKPNPGLVNRAVGKHGINIHKSWFIGDSTVDVKTGENANLKTILLKSGIGGKDHKYDVEPNYKFKNLLTAAKFIAKLEKKDVYYEPRCSISKN